MPTSKSDDVLLRILQQLLEEDKDITAREVARRHPNLKAASSITRNRSRSALLAEYKNRQNEYRNFATRAGRIYPSIAKDMVARYEEKISELERSVQILTASHLAMIRAVGAVGGFKKWQDFFELDREVRYRLIALGATS